MPQTAKGCVAGVDVGSVLNVKISKLDEEGNRISQYIGTVPTFEDIDRLIAQYGIECLVIDALPETHKVKELRDRNRGIVWMCEYHSKQGSTKGLTIDDDEYKVSIDRTQSLDNSHSDILLKKVIYPSNARKIDEGNFYKQMCAPKRIFKEDKNRYIWDEGGKPDHYRHAENYEKIAQDLIQATGVKIWDLG